MTEVTDLDVIVELAVLLENVQDVLGALIRRENTRAELLVKANAPSRLSEAREDADQRLQRLTRRLAEQTEELNRSLERMRSDAPRSLPTTERKTTAQIVTFPTHTERTSS